MRILQPYKYYFWDFYNQQNQNVKDKIDYVLQIIISVRRVPVKFLRHLEYGIYEIRIEFRGNTYRIFCFFDEDKLVILINGFQKKSHRAPRKEIERAKTLRRNYYEDKKSKDNQRAF